MSETTLVDARGLSCPQPVLLTRKAMKQLKTGTFEVLVDTVTSRDNCTRIAQKNGWSVSSEEQPDGTHKLAVTK